MRILATATITLATFAATTACTSNNENTTPPKTSTIVTTTEPTVVQGISNVSPACAGLKGIVVGTGPGSQNTRAATVFAFVHRYHAERDPARTFALIHPDARVTIDSVRRGINSYPHGLHYCTAITKITNDAIWATTAAVYQGTTYIPVHEVITMTPTAPYQYTGLYQRYESPPAR